MKDNYYKPRIKTEIIEQMPQPNDEESERAVLATLMQYPEYYTQHSDLLSTDLFYSEKSKSIYQCLDGLLSQGKIANINALSDYANSHELSLKLQRFDFVEIFQYSSPSTFKQDLDRIIALSTRRKLWEQFQIASKRIQDRMIPIDETVSNLTEILNEIGQSSANEGISSFRDAVKELSGIVQGNQEGKRVAVYTGFSLFDNYYLLRPSTLTVIAAFTSVGKSALAMNIAKNAAKSGTNVGYYSLEMGKSELAARGLSGIVGLSASAIMNRKLEKPELENFKKAIEKEADLPIYIDERATVTFSRTIRSIRTLKKTKDVGLVIIDYLQIYSQVSDNSEQSLAYMARAAKNIAKELSIPVILLSQLNRSGEHPSIKMLRGSGQIEESADNIVLIDRPEAYPDNTVKHYIGEFKDADTRGTAKLILAKGRGVGTGCELIGFEPRFTQFYELNQKKPFEDIEIPF